MSDAANDAMAEGFARDDEPGFEITAPTTTKAMTTEEKLNAILAKCRAFLEEKAAKRTPGEWEVDQSTTWDQSRGIHPQIVQRYAACAGQAEAMARSTIAAIEFFRRGRFELSSLTRDILAAWPDKLLQTTAGRCSE